MNLVCINCPLGCHLEVSKNGDEIVVSGNTCIRGKQYAINELTHPKRMLTSTIEIENGTVSRLAVITSEAIDKDLLFDVMRVLKDIKVKAPIKINEVIIPNILDTGVDIIASRTVEKLNKNC